MRWLQCQRMRWSECQPGGCGVKQCSHGADFGHENRTCEYTLFLRVLPLTVKMAPVAHTVLLTDLSSFYFWSEIPVIDPSCFIIVFQLQTPLKTNKRKTHN